MLTNIILYILYSMLVGTLPFDRHGGDLNLTLQQVASGVYERPAHVSAEGLDLLDKLLDVVCRFIYVDFYYYYYLYRCVFTASLLYYSHTYYIPYCIFYTIYTESADPAQGSGCTPPPFPSMHSYENYREK